MKKVKIIVFVAICLFAVETIAYATTYWPYYPSPTIQPRTAWNASAPSSGLTAIGTTTRLIFHHTGWNFSNTGYSDCAAEVKKIQDYHMNNNGWSDIGYHYVIDPAGRIWEGRLTLYQGAHTIGYNDDIGIVNLGDYEGLWGVGANSVTQSSYNAMCEISKRLAWVYDIDLPVVYNHNDFSSTACPGQNMEMWVWDSLAGYMYNWYSMNN